MWEQIQNKNHCVDKMVSVTSQQSIIFFKHYCTEIYHMFFSFSVF